MPKYATSKKSFLIIFLLTPISILAAASCSNTSKNAMAAFLQAASYIPPCPTDQIYAVHPGYIFNRACSFATGTDTQSFEAIALFTQLFFDPVYSPEARYKAALLIKGASAKHSVLARLIGANCLDFPNPEAAFSLQKKSCDMLIQAYTEEKNSDSTLVSAQNKLAITLNYTLDRNIELKYFPRNCLNALAIISDHALAQPDIALLYLPCESPTEQEQFLDKVFRSAARYHVPSAALMLVLASANRALACDNFASVHQQYGHRAIEDLCTATKQGHTSACELALALASTKAYAEESLMLLEAAATTGNILAHYKLGRHYKTILTVSNDKSLEEIKVLQVCAQKHLMIAADAKLPEAQLDLATMPKPYTQMILALSPFARDATFALQAVAQEHLAVVLCSWADHCLERGISASPYTPTTSYLLASSLFEKAIRSVKEPLSSLIFSNYIKAVRSFAALTPSLTDQQKAYTLALAFLKEQTIKHPIAQDAYNELAHNRTLSNQEIETNVCEIQMRDYFINKIMSRARLEPGSATRMKLYTMAETYLDEKPENAMIASLKGLVAFCKGDYSAACKCFRTVIQDNPQDISSQYLLSIISKKSKA